MDAVQLDAAKLHVYHVALDLHTLCSTLVASLNRIVRDQLERASLSVVLNVAEAGGRHSRREKARFYAIARGSATEVAALFDVLERRRLAPAGDPGRADAHPHEPEAGGVIAYRERVRTPSVRVRGLVGLLARPVSWVLIAALPVQAIPLVPSARIVNGQEVNGVAEGPHPQTPAPWSVGIGGGGSGHGTRARRERAWVVGVGLAGVALSRDDMGRMVRTEYADLTFEESTYDHEGRRLSSRDRRGKVTTYEYDDVGRLKKTIFPDATFTENTYDAAGRLAAVRDARGKTTTYEYDRSGRRTKVTVPLTAVLSAETVFTYDASGNQLTVRDPLERTTTFEYDELNRRKKTIFHDTTYTETTYDELGRRKTERDQAGRVTSFGYDPLGRLTSVTDARGKVTSYEYDELGNRVRQIDANDHATAFEYDRLGREIKRLLPGIGTADPAFETKSYDDAGNLESRTDFAGRVTAYTYDVMNRLLARTAQCAPIPCAGAADASFTYTPSGRRETVTDARGVTEYEYDDRDRLQSLTYPDGRKLEYLYDGNGNRTTLTATIPAVGGGSPTVLTTAYTYDDANRLDLVTDTAGRTYDHGYDLNGNRTTLAQPNGTLTSYTYNTLNRLTNLSTTHPGLGTTIQSYGLTLGPAGNRERIDEADGTSRIYTYDELYRLTSDTVSIGALNQYSKGFTYDDVGNRQTQTTSIGPAGSPGPNLTAGTLTYAYDQRDRLTSETLNANPATAYSWDADGNLVTKSGEATYTWDRENRLTRVDKTDGTIVEHTYDADGVRVQTITTPSGGSAATTNFLVDTSGSLSHVVAETDVDGKLVVHYVRGDDLLALMRAPAGSPTPPIDWLVRYYHADHIGSVRRLTNEAGQITDGYTYSAFGELLAHTGTDPQPYALTGQPYDPNLGFQYHRARWMDPRVGRFVGMDPFEGLQHEPLTLHKYLYAGADPGNKIDPSGLMTLPELAIVAAIITGLISASITAYRGGSPAEIVTAGVVTGLAAGVVVYGGVPLLIAGGSVTAGLVAIGRHAGVNVALQFANVIRQVGVRLSATGTPPTPNGMSLPQFGTQVMQWGTGAQAALQRIASLTPEQLRAAGVTVEIAARWRDFYINVAMRNPANTSAVGRAVLMHHAAMLLE